MPVKIVALSVLLAAAGVAANAADIRTDLCYPHVIGYHRTLVAGTNGWKYIDIDLSKAPGKVARK
ncbi:MAG: hypothetical protein ABIR98_16180 [Usitatibacter sp.]